MTISEDRVITGLDTRGAVTTGTSGAVTTGTSGAVTTGTSGATIWLTGLPSAGKSTIAFALAERLRAEGRRVEVLDGDQMRATLTAGLGFSRGDRETNVARIGFVAELLARNGVLVLAPVVSPHAAARDRLRHRHAASDVPFVEVHVTTPVDVCSDRDVKGLYAQQRAGTLTGLTGVDDEYEVPESPDVQLVAHGRDVDATVTELHDALIARGVL